jgi:hypothetical protein
MGKLLVKYHANRRLRDREGRKAVDVSFAFVFASQIEQER